jgi:hypothetical protein
MMGRNMAMAAASNVAFAAVRYRRSSLSKALGGANLILSGRFSVIACHDDAGFGFDDCGRSDFLICWVAGAREQAEKCYGN